MNTFEQGIIYSAAWITESHGYDSVSVELLKAAGLGWADVLKADEHDINILKKLKKEIERR